MKKIILSFLAIVMVVCFSNKVMAQNVSDTKSNDANAQIVGGIALTAVSPLEFGGIIPDASAPGTVVISTAGARSFTVVSVVTASTTPSAASYTVVGTGLVPYTISIPTSFNITNTTGGGAETMSVNAMTCSDGLSHTFLANGTDAFTVGGTLTVGANQEPGLYTGEFDVTVAY